MASDSKKYQPVAASTRASCGRERAFSCSHPHWIVVCLTLREKEVQKGRATMGTEKAEGDVETEDETKEGGQ
ncbi:hypothetical protein KSZ_06810 [Dictyobacter formicarum]|uniref:Uncharacterized protein n=1 Tax=Dictyobacter formicarum TaxID=2778368 RepID=A0ABQ3V9R7_9CHLR|nr:hypothetical protein KSZ_06810 [Dictyobacter formicarum]